MELTLILSWIFFCLASGLIESYYATRGTHINHIGLTVFRSVVLSLLAIPAGLPLMGIIIIALALVLIKWALEADKNWKKAAYVFFGCAMIFIYTISMELYEPLTFMVGAICVFMFFHDGMFYVGRWFFRFGSWGWSEFIEGEPGPTSYMDRQGWTTAKYRVIALMAGIVAWTIFYFDKFLSY